MLHHGTLPLLLGLFDQLMLGLQHLLVLLDSQDCLSFILLSLLRIPSFTLFKDPNYIDYPLLIRIHTSVVEASSLTTVLVSLSP